MQHTLYLYGPSLLFLSRLFNLTQSHICDKESKLQSKSCHISTFPSMATLYRCSCRIRECYKGPEGFTRVTYHEQRQHKLDQEVHNLGLDDGEARQSTASPHTAGPVNMVLPAALADPYALLPMAHSTQRPLDSHHSLPLDSLRYNKSEEMVVSSSHSLTDSALLEAIQNLNAEFCQHSTNMHTATGRGVHDPGQLLAVLHTETEWLLTLQKRLQCEFERPLLLSAVSRGSGSFLAAAEHQCTYLVSAIKAQLDSMRIWTDYTRKLQSRTHFSVESLSSLNMPVVYTGLSLKFVPENH